MILLKESLEIRLDVYYKTRLGKMANKGQYLARINIVPFDVIPSVLVIILNIAALGPPALPALATIILAVLTIFLPTSRSNIINAISFSCLLELSLLLILILGMNYRLLKRVSP